MMNDALGSENSLKLTNERIGFNTVALHYIEPSVIIQENAASTYPIFFGLIVLLSARILTLYFSNNCVVMMQFYVIYILVFQLVN